MIRSTELVLDILAGLAKTEKGRKALASAASFLVGTVLVGVRNLCSHPLSQIVWVNNREGVCRMCGRKVALKLKKKEAQG